MSPETIVILTPDSLRESLTLPLPGPEAQYRMAATGRPGPEWSANPPADTRRAAVLVLFYPHADGLYLPMMVRPARDNDPHSRQVSFPGGSHEADKDAGDLARTALRESQEELAIDPRAVRLLGTLSPIYIGASNFHVIPYVGWSDTRPAFTPDPGEVDEILEIPLSFFLDEKNRDSEMRDTRYGHARIPFFRFGQHKIWGASAMVLSELLEVLSRHRATGSYK